MRALPILTALAVVLTACREPDPAPAPSPPDGSPITSWPATRTTDGARFVVTLDPGPEGIALNRHFSLDLSVDAGEIDPSTIEVLVDADMPGHGHGMNTKPELSRKGTLRFQVDGMLFHMAGDWEVWVDIKHEGNTRRATFPVRVE